MPTFQSDALVFFGATGDLAYKQIFPSIQGLIRDEGLNMPIIGVAKSGWSLDQLLARAKDSLEHHGGLDQNAFKKLTELLRYVDGDYADAATFANVRKELGAAKQPLHYLAIPPSLFGVVAEGLAKSGCGDNARVVVEKPFGHDLASAQELNQILHRILSRGANLPHRSLPRQGAGAEHPVYAIRQPDLRADLESQLRPQHPDHDGGEVRRAGSRPVLRRDRGATRCGPESHAAGALQPHDGSADR